MARSRKVPSRRPSILRRIARLLSAALGLVIAVVLLLLVFPSAGIFGPLRASIVEQALGRVFGRPVEIEGPVEFVIGSQVRVTASKINVLRDAADGSGEPDRIGHGEVGFALAPLLRADLELTAVSLSGVSLAEDTLLVGIEPGTRSEEPRWVGIVPGVIRLARRADVSISDVTYAYHDEDTGWVFDIALAELANTRPPDGGATTIVATGELNGAAVRIDGEIDSRLEEGLAAGDAFTMTLSSPGGSISMEGTVPAGPSPRLRDVTLAADLSSLGDTLDAFRIARTLEGTATASARIEITGAILAVRDLDSALTIQDGPTIRTTGTVEDIADGKGLDLEIDANLPPGVGDLSEDDGLLTFAVYDISARLSGDVGALVMTDGWIDTNLFSDALPWLGPITAEAVRRDDQGRIAVDGLNVLAGPPDARTLDLNGSIGDLLALSDFRLAGQVAVPVAELLRIADSNAALGRLTGHFAFSDASGTAGIDTVVARISGSHLVSADVNFTADQSQSTETATLALRFDVPDYASLATELGIDPEPIGKIAFDGNLSLSPESGGLKGQFDFGRTEVTGDLAVEPKDGRPFVSGKVSTPEIVVADLRHLFAVVNGFGRLRAAATKPDGGTARHTRLETAPPIVHPRVDVEVEAGRIDATGDDVSGVTGRLLYDDGVASAEQVRLRYRSGQFRFDAEMKVHEPALPFTANGRMDDWPLSDVFADLGVDLPVQGTLDASFDVASSGTSVRAAVADAKGNVYLDLRKGIIGNRLLDLTGLVLPSWLFAPSAKTGESHIECFTAKIDFAPGVADIRRAVVETDDVVVTASGRIDFRNDTVSISASPHALQPNLIPIVSPFTIEGPLSHPKVVLEGGVAGRVVAETLALPFNALGTLFGVDRSAPKPRSQRPSC